MTTLFSISETDQLTLALRDRRRWFYAALAEIEEAIESSITPSNAMTEFISFVGSELSQINKALNLGDGSDYNLVTLLYARSSLPTTLASDLGKVLGTETEEEVARIERRLNARVNERLDRGNVWRPYTTAIVRRPQRELNPPREYLSLLTPLNKAFALEVGEYSFARHGRGGLSSNTLAGGSTGGLPGLANCWHSVFKNPSGEVIFEGFRSAALGAPSLTSDIERGALGKEAARELLKAMVARKLQLLPELGRRLILEQRSMNLNIASLNLQTYWPETDSAWLALNSGIPIPA